VALVIELNIRLCKFEDAVVHIDTNRANSAKANMIIKSESIENTMTQVCLDTVHDIKLSVGWNFVDVTLLVVSNSSVTRK